MLIASQIMEKCKHIRDDYRCVMTVMYIVFRDELDMDDQYELVGKGVLDPEIYCRIYKESHSVFLVGNFTCQIIYQT